MKNKVSFDFKHGKVEGLYLSIESGNAPLVIITNGQNGFYNYGMFPYIQEKLFESGIASYSYNFSHGGILGNSDYFSELDLYEKNCMRLETEDLCEIVKHLKESEIKFTGKNKLIFFSHSMGSVPTIFGTKELLSKGYKVDGVILVSPVNSLDRWSEEIMEDWEKNGVRLVKNNRTKQDLPQGKEFLEEVKEANGIWNIRNALKGANTNYLIIHGDNDEAVPVEQSIDLNNWNSEYKHNTTLKIIPNGTHTFNTQHPFEVPSEELDLMIKESVAWINKL